MCGYLRLSQFQHDQALAPDAVLRLSSSSPAQTHRDQASPILPHHTRSLKRTKRLSIAVLTREKKRKKHPPDIPKALRFETRLEPYPAHDTRIKSRVRRQFCRRRCVHVRIYGLVQVHRQPAPPGVLALRRDRYGRRRRRRRRRRFSPNGMLMRADVRDEEGVVARTWRRRFRARFGRFGR